MVNNPAIVVVAYNRPASLWRLLNSLANASYPVDDIPLIISIDNNDSEEVFKAAEYFEWKHGIKKIMTQAAHLGLKEHILRCGDLTSEYHSIIVLEDDLLVSPHFYSYAVSASTFYLSESNIAGISLYNYEVAESCFYPFKAIDDGTDVYFMQVASSWGQLWTCQQWESFRTWLAKNPELAEKKFLPKYLLDWGKNSWKKHFIHYLIATNKYFVFPRLSLTTNFEEPGTNSKTKKVFDVTLQLVQKRYSFVKIENSGAKYDAWFEISPESINRLNPALNNYDYVVDLYGSKEIKSGSKPFALTIKRASNPENIFSSDLFPLETNVALNLNGKSIGLYKTEGNKFENTKPNIRNLLEIGNKNNDPGISIIIPAVKLASVNLQKTIDSILAQNYLRVEIVIVVDVQYVRAAEKLLSYEHININIVVCEPSAALDKALEIGLKNAKEDILCWVNPGSFLKPNCLEKVASIFKSNQTINWIRGVDEGFSTDEEYSKVRTLKYRLVPGEAYKRLQKDELNVSMELQFFTRTCFQKINLKNLTQENLFFEFITNFQMIVVVENFGHIFSNSENALLGHDIREVLLSNYSHLRYKNRLSSKFINLLIRTPFFNDGSWQWYNTSLNNFPDVLRYDSRHNSFFFSKY